MGKIQISYSCTEIVKEHNLSAVKSKNFTGMLPIHTTNFSPEFIIQNDVKNEEFNIKDENYKGAVFSILLPLD